MSCDANNDGDCGECPAPPSSNQCSAVCRSTGNRCNRRANTLIGKLMFCKQHAQDCSYDRIEAYRDACARATSLPWFDEFYSKVMDSQGYHVYLDIPIEEIERGFEFLSQCARRKTEYQRDCVAPGAGEAGHETFTTVVQAGADELLRRMHDHHDRMEAKEAMQREYEDAQLAKRLSQMRVQDEIEKAETRNEKRLDNIRRSEARRKREEALMAKKQAEKTAEKKRERNRKKKQKRKKRAVFPEFTDDVDLAQVQRFVRMRTFYENRVGHLVDWVKWKSLHEAYSTVLTKDVIGELRDLAIEFANSENSTRSKWDMSLRFVKFYMRQIDTHPDTTLDELFNKHITRMNNNFEDHMLYTQVAFLLKSRSLVTTRPLIIDAPIMALTYERAGQVPKRAVYFCSGCNSKDVSRSCDECGNVYCASCYDDLNRHLAIELVTY